MDGIIYDETGAFNVLYEYQLDTPKEDFYNISPQVWEAISESGVMDGIAVVFCPHTTAGITVNENADPNVLHDLLLGLRKSFPHQSGFIHAESNSAAHLKSSCVGSSVTLIVKDGKPLLGTWQGIYFCEFDPPRSRKFCVKVM